MVYQVWGDLPQTIETKTVRLRRYLLHRRSFREHSWRTVDQVGEVVDVYLRAKRDRETAKRAFKPI